MDVGFDSFNVAARQFETMRVVEKKGSFSSFPSAYNLDSRRAARKVEVCSRKSTWKFDKVSTTDKRCGSCKPM